MWSHATSMFTRIPRTRGCPDSRSSWCAVACQWPGDCFSNHLSFLEASSNRCWKNRWAQQCDGVGTACCEKTYPRFRGGADSNRAGGIHGERLRCPTKTRRPVIEALAGRGAIMHIARQALRVTVRGHQAWRDRAMSRKRDPTKWSSRRLPTFIVLLEAVAGFAESMLSSRRGLVSTLYGTRLL